MNAMPLAQNATQFATPQNATQQIVNAAPQFAAAAANTQSQQVKINIPKFHFIESLRHTAIFEEFEFLRQFSKKQNMIKKNYQLNRNEKFVDKAQQCFTFLHIKT